MTTWIALARFAGIPYLCYLHGKAATTAICSSPGLERAQALFLPLSVLGQGPIAVICNTSGCARARTAGANVTENHSPHSMEGTSWALQEDAMLRREQRCNIAGIATPKPETLRAVDLRTFLNCMSGFPSSQLRGSKLEVQEQQEPTFRKACACVRFWDAAAFVIAEGR